MTRRAWFRLRNRWLWPLSYPFRLLIGDASE